jgi:hypothetical protein
MCEPLLVLHYMHRYCTFGKFAVAHHTSFQQEALDQPSELRSQSQLTARVTDQ